MRTLLIICVLTLAVGSGAAQTSEKLEKSIYIQAEAEGNGMPFGVTAVIDRYSSPGDQQMLLDAFRSGGNDGLLSTLADMSSKGRIAVTGSLGNDVAYIRRFPQPDGTSVIRMITTRPLPFPQAWGGDREAPFRITAMEVVLGRDGKHNKGTLYPAAEVKVNKAGELEFEAFQNPWNLVEIDLR